MIGTGFWSRFQLPAWRELGGVHCVALCDRTRSRAEAVAEEFAVPAVYDDVEELLTREQLDFVDIVTPVETHAELVTLAARNGLPVICQKPMATSFAEAAAMVQTCLAAGTPFLIHENWRWQPQIRALADALASGDIGTPFRARIDMITGFPVFQNQPALAELEQFIIVDLGSHILDVARFLFGEPTSIYCSRRRIHPDIRGEDVATIVLTTPDEITVVCELAYAENHVERECFPQTLIFVEGDRGSIELASNYRLRVTTSAGTFSRRFPPPRYTWADPFYDVVHASIVPCNADLLAALRREGTAETTGVDNLKTIKLVFAAYESASTNTVVPV